MLAEFRTPHIGETTTKTNGIRAQRQAPATPGNGLWQAFGNGNLEDRY